MMSPLSLEDEDEEDAGAVVWDDWEAVVEADDAGCELDGEFCAPACQASPSRTRISGSSLILWSIIARLRVHP